MQVNHLGEFVHHDDLVLLRHFLMRAEVMEGIDRSKSLVDSPAQRPVAKNPFKLLGSCCQVNTPFKLCLILIIDFKEPYSLIGVEILVSFIDRVHISNDVIG